MRPFERAIRYLQALQRGEAISTAWLRQRFGLSKAQAKRDMHDLERLLPLRHHQVLMQTAGGERVCNILHIDRDEAGSRA